MFHYIILLIDLNFVITLLDSIIRGLQRLAGKNQSNIIGQNRGENGDGYQDQDQRSFVSRPYLSEAWDVLDIERKKEKKPLMNWRIPVSGNEIDMKERIRFWAHSVASTVR